LVLCFTCGLLPAAEPVTEIEEIVATCKSPNNGAGPLWCYGAPLLVRQGDRVFVSVMETGAGAPPNNTRWRLFEGDDKGWTEARHADAFREREPCPLVNAGRGKVWLSVNPSTHPTRADYGPCDPHFLLFEVANATQRPAVVRPDWSSEAKFTEHSYRGFSADPTRGDLIAMNIDARTSEQRWFYRDVDGKTTRTGAIRFVVRACYPQVAIRDRAAHVLAIGDIVEPNEDWRRFKKEKTGSAWDYVFRRLFYSWNPDTTKCDFELTLEIDSVEATGGHITNLDLWLDANGRAHVLFLKTNISGQLRDKFFPDQKLKTTLEHLVIERGRVIRNATLMHGGEGHRVTPRYARFHATPEGALYIITAVSGSRQDGSSFFENRIIQVSPRGDLSTKILLQEPFGTFFTAAERGGNAPSKTLDLFGTGRDETILRYARVRVP
jgi:hypothetical protein